MSPIIFNDKERNDMREKMLQTGFVSIKNLGYKKTSVEDIAKSSGIAKGTFYNFFKSKEHFVTEVIKYKSLQLREKIMSFYTNKPLNTRESIYDFAKFIVSNEDDNLYRYLKFEEINQIMSKVPEFVPPDDVSYETTNALLALIPNKSPDCDWRVLVNYVRLITLMKNFDDSAGFYNEVLDKNVNAIINLIVDEILGKQ